MAFTLGFDVRAAVQGKRVVITGASDGIGARLAVRLAAAGAHVILVARTAEKLRSVAALARAAGGAASVHAADLSKDEDCQRAAGEVVAEHGGVDIFISNAGRSIRRGVLRQGQERFHDFQRLMALNFFGALRMVLGVLPSMVEQRGGHILHVSSFAVPTRQTRFAGYAASKAALDGALQALAGEVAGQGVAVSTVYMPLVRTGMSEAVKGHSYEHVPQLDIDQACGLIERALVTKEQEVIDIPSKFQQSLYLIRPSLMLLLNSLIFRSEREAPEAAVGAAPKTPRGPRGRGRSGLRAPPASMRCLLSIMAFFQGLEAWLVMLLGLPGSLVFRNLGIIVVVLMVSAVHVAFCWLASAWALVRGLGQQQKAQALLVPSCSKPAGAACTISDKSAASQDETCPGSTSSLGSETDSASHSS